MALVLAVGLASAAPAQVTPAAVQTAVSGPWAAAQAGPIGMAVDPSGNLYVAEYAGEAVLRVSAATGAVTTFTTTCGTRGLNHPGYLAADGSGNLYVASPTDSAIFVYSTGTGTCNLQYGAGGASPLGLALDASGNLFYTTYLYASGLAVGVYEIPAGSATGTSGTAVITTGLSNAAGIAFDPVSGDMLVADRGAGAVYRYAKSAGFAASSQTTFVSGLSAPSGLAFDGQDNLYVALAGANTVMRYAYADGAASAVQMTPYVNDPEGMTVDAAGALYQAAEAGNAVAAFTSRLGAVPVGSSSGAASANFVVQGGTTIGSFQLRTQGLVGGEWAAPSSDANPYLCAAGSYGTTTACSVDAALTPVYAGVRAGAVEVLDANGAVLAAEYVQGTGTGPQVAFAPATASTVSLGGGLASVAAVALDGAGTAYLAGSDANGKALIVREPAGGAAAVVASQAAGSQLTAARGVAVDGAGNVFVAGATAGGNGAVVKESLTAAGGYTESLAASDTGGPGTSAVQFPYGVAVDGAGDVFVAGADNAGEGIVAEETPSDGGYAETAVAAHATGSALMLPKGVAVDSAGDLFIADATPGAAIYEEAPKATGGYTETALRVSAITPVTHAFTAVTLDAHGDLFLADGENNAVFEETAGTASYVESQLATSALSGPSGVALDGHADLAIVDAGHARVLEETYAAAPAVTFAATPAGGTSAVTTVTLANRGNAALGFPAPVAGANPVVTGPFALSSGVAGDCPVIAASGTAASLAAGASCALPLTFTPTATGAATGTLTLTDTQGNAGAPAYATQTIALSGGAVNGPTQLLLSDVPPSVTAGSGLGTILVSLANAQGTVVTGAREGVVLTITGPGQYAVSQTATATNGEASFAIMASGPTVAGAYTVTATSSGLSSATASFTVTAAAAQTTALSGVAATVTQSAGLGTLTATVVDSYGNTVTTASMRLTASVRAPGGAVTTVSAQATNGIAAFHLSGIALTATGNWAVTVAGAGLTTSGETVAVTAATAAQGFSLAVTPGSASSAGPVGAGQAASYSLTLAPTAGSYALPITLAVTGLPANATASFAPATVTPGSAAAGVTLTVQVGSGSARLGSPVWEQGPGGFVLAALALPLAGMRRRRGQRGATGRLVAVLALGMAAVAGLSGCSGGASAPSPSGASYTLTVTATSGSLSQSTTLTLLEP